VSRRLALHQFNFKNPVRAAQFSPDDKFLAVARGSRLEIWHAPQHRRDLAPFVLHASLAGHHGDITTLDWSADGRYVLTGSKDHSCRIWSAYPQKATGYVPFSLTGHKDSIVGCFFSPDGDAVYSVAKDCVVYVWQWQPDSAADFAEPGASGGGALAAVEVLLTQAGGADGPVKPQGPTLHPALGKWALHSKHFLWDQGKVSSGATGVPKKKSRKKKRGAAAAQAAEDDDDDVGGDPTLDASGNQIGGPHLRVRSAELHRHTKLLAVGLSNGTFSLFDMGSVFDLMGSYSGGGLAPTSFKGSALSGVASSGGGGSLSPVHTLSISQADVSTVAINGSGEWLAFGAAGLGQLLVWEWQSESYVLKQQGHSYDMNALAFSPDGTVIATGADDAKVKLWSASSGFCFATLADHTAPVTAVCFGPAAGRVVLTSSLDGTVRAYDLLRYKNFRVLCAPDPVGFSCLAVDPSGEVVCAGGVDPFEIYVWALQTGKLLDVLAGHKAPLSCLSFDAASGTLASGAWDKTVKVWNVWKSECVETLEHPADVLCCAFRPDGKQLVVGTLHGQLHVWDPIEGDELGVIDGQRDIAGGRGENDRATSASSAARRHFSSVCYSADGACVLAGGRSRFVCIYEVTQQILLKKFQVSHNRSRDGVLDKLHSGALAHGSGEVVHDDGSDSDEGGPAEELLPGATRTEDGKRRGARKEIRVTGVQFSSTGREWAAATSDGLLIYALSDDLLFAPVGLEGEDVTPSAAKQCLKRRDYARALLMALQLGDGAAASQQADLLSEVLESVPSEDVGLVVASLGNSSGAVVRLVEALAPRLAASRHLEFYLNFALATLSAHGALLFPKGRSATSRGALGSAAAVGAAARAAGSASRSATSAQRLSASLAALQRAVLRQQQVLLSLCDENDYTLRFLSTTSTTTASDSNSPSDVKTPALGASAPLARPAPVAIGDDDSDAEADDDDDTNRATSMDDDENRDETKSGSQNEDGEELPSTKEKASKKALRETPKVKSAKKKAKRA